MKKIFPFVRYFFYLGWNWNWRVALYIIHHEIKGEKKYDINTTGADELRKMAAGGLDITHATVYMPITYFQLEEIFSNLPLKERTHFMDIGCGKGRALSVAAHFGFYKVTGVDFSSELCEAASQNLQNTRQLVPHLNYAILHQDAASTKIPGDVDCIFFFNPFDMFIMKQVVENICSSLLLHNRQLCVVYANPLYKQLFLENNFIETYYSKRLKYLELSILSFQHV